MLVIQNDHRVKLALIIINLVLTKSINEDLSGPSKDFLFMRGYGIQGFIKMIRFSSSRALWGHGCSSSRIMSTRRPT